MLGRRVRATPDRADAHLGDADPRRAALARGVRRHFDDDARFHTSASFAAASAEVAALLRPLREREPTLRPSFVAHVLVEVVLDAELFGRDPARADRYYALLATLDADAMVPLCAPLATQHPAELSVLVRRFLDARFVADYADDRKLARRLDQVFRRTRQPLLADVLPAAMPPIRAAVARRVDDLLP